MSRTVSVMANEPIGKPGGSVVSQGGVTVQDTIDIVLREVDEDDSIIKADDPRLADTRVPGDRTVTDAQVADDADIEPAKIAGTAVVQSDLASGLAAEVVARDDAVASESDDRAAADAALQSDVDSKVPLSQRGATDGVATLDSDGKVPSAQMPPVAVTDSFAVATEAAMLALTAERGDVAIRSDLNKSFILSTDSPSTLGDWLELKTPTDAVSSVAGRTGVVTLGSSDVGLGNVDNTADTAKPVSTAQATAIGVVQSDVDAHEALANNPHSVTKTQIGLSNVDNTADTAKPVSTAQQTALDAKAATADARFPTADQKAALAPFLAGSGNNPFVTVGWLPYINPKDYGAKGDGVTDDTAAIDAAFAVGGRVAFPAGNFVYNGNGYSGDNPVVIGVDKSKTTITLGAGKSLLTRASAYTSLTLRDVTVSGGFGAIRHTYTGVNVQTSHEVTRCYFLNYTGAAISTLSSDMPFWRITHNKFYAANDTSTIGIVLTGNTDDCVIEDNDFDLNRVHIKATHGGNSLHLHRNGFTRWSGTSSNPRIDVWIVPHTSLTNSGQGFTATKNKFGNENFLAGDLKVVYADEDTSSGTDHASYFPKLSADSTGYITSHTFTDNLCGGANVSGGFPFVYSTTPNVDGCTYAGMFVGSTPTYILQFRTVTTVPNRDAIGNLIGPWLGDNSGVETLPPVASNDNTITTVIDPFVTMAGPGYVLTKAGGSDPGGYTSILATPVRSFSTVGASLSNVADTLGGTEATEATYASATEQVYAYITPTAGIPVWIEFDIKQGGSSALAQIAVQIVRDTWQSGGALHFRRVVSPSAAWQRYRFCFVPRTITGAIIVDFLPLSGTGKVQIGRVRVYHAYEPQVDISARLDAYAARVNALTDAATIAVDASLAQVHTVTLGGNRTLGNPTNPVNGARLMFRVTQDGTGTRTLAYGSDYRFGAVVQQPVLSTTAGKTDYIGFIYNGAAVKWDCIAFARGY